MSETETNSTSRAAQADCLCGTVRKLAEEMMSAIGPDENVAKHFREARVHLLLGFRQLIDNRIDDLNRTRSKGARVVVE